MPCQKTQDKIRHWLDTFVVWPGCDNCEYQSALYLNSQWGLLSQFACDQHFNRTASLHRHKTKTIFECCFITVQCSVMNTWNSCTGLLLNFSHLILHLKVQELLHGKQVSAPTLKFLHNSRPNLQYSAMLLKLTMILRHCQYWIQTLLQQMQMTGCDHGRGRWAVTEK